MGQDLGYIKGHRPPMLLGAAMNSDPYTPDTEGSHGAGPGCSEVVIGLNLLKITPKAILLDADLFTFQSVFGTKNA